MLYVNLFALLLTHQLLASIESAVIPVFDIVKRNSSGVGMSFEDEMVDTRATSLDYGHNDSMMMLTSPETSSVNDYYNETQTQAEKQLLHALSNETELLTMSSEKEDTSESDYETTNKDIADEDFLVNEEDQAEHLTTSSEEERLSESAYTTNNGTEFGISQLKEDQTGNLNASSEEKDSTESANITANNYTETEISLANETDQSHADMDSAGPELFSVIEIFDQLLLKLGLNSTNTQSYDYVPALRNPDGSLYIPHQPKQSKEKHLETLLGFAEEIWKGKRAKAAEPFVKYEETEPVGDTTMPPSTTSSHQTIDNWDDVFSFENEEGQTDANMSFIVDLEAKNVSLGPMQDASNEPNESVANHTLGTHSKMTESTEKSNQFFKETDQAVNATDSSEIDEFKFSTTTEYSLPADDDQNTENFSQLSSQLTLIHDQLFNNTKEIMQYLTDIVHKVGGELNHTL